MMKLRFRLLPILLNILCLGFTLNINAQSQINQTTQFNKNLYGGLGDYRVGIGTTSPQALFDISKGSSRLLFDPDNEFLNMGFNGGDDYIYLYGLGTYSTHYLQFTVGDQSAFYQYNNRFIFQSGNVGMGGINDPAYPLSVYGNIQLTGIGESDGYVLTSDPSGVGSWLPTSNTAWSLTGNLNTDTAINYIGVTDAQPLKFGIGGEQVGMLSLASTYNVAFGFNSAKHTIASDIVAIGRGAGEYATENKGIYLGASSGQNSQSGYAVMIGEESGLNAVGAELTFLGSKSGKNSGTSTVGKVTLLGTRTDWTGDIGNSTAIGSDVVLTESNTIILGNNCNVGIGTTDPAAKLEINGTIRITDGTQANGYVLTSDANGIGSWQQPSTNSNMQKESPTSGSTVNSDGSPQLIINPLGPLLDLTVNFPSAPTNGKLFSIASTQAITTLTLLNGTILGTLSTLAINGYATWIYVSEITSWVRKS